MIAHYAGMVREMRLPFSELAIRRAFPELSLFTVGKVLQYLTLGRIENNEIPQEKVHSTKKKLKFIRSGSGVEGVVFNQKNQKWNVSHDGRYKKSFEFKQDAINFKMELREKDRAQTH